MMQFDHDKFLPLFVKLSTSPNCTNTSTQYNGTHYDNNAQHGARYNSIKHTTLPLPGKSQHTLVSFVVSDKALSFSTRHLSFPPTSALSENCEFRNWIKHVTACRTCVPATRCDTTKKWFTST